MNATCYIIFCVIVKVIPRISLQNFMKSKSHLSQEIEKNTEDVLPPSPQKTKQN